MRSSILDCDLLETSNSNKNIKTIGLIESLNASLVLRFELAMVILLVVHSPLSYFDM